MKVYFYHTQDIQMILRRLGKGEFPPHFLYGATKLNDYGIEVAWHQSRLNLPRWKMMLRTAWHILTCHEKYDAVYATHYRGLELIVFLRALRLFRKPLIVWHHQPVIKSPSRWREFLGRLFYKGFDQLIFFSDKLLSESLATGKVRAERLHVVPWGMDIPSFAIAVAPVAGRGMVFVSSGKEMRDMPTLVEAFNRTGAELQIYINRRNGDIDYDSIFRDMRIKENIHIHFQTQLAPYEISLKVMQADCVCICCQPTKYTVGLTTVVEALALGKPMICSRNPQIPVDIDRERCGITVEYGDTDGWVAAIDHLRSHPDEARAMGLRGQALARTKYNDRRCAAAVAEIIRSTCAAQQ